MAQESWMELSRSLVSIVKRVSPSVVRVDGGRRRAASGIVWSADGVVVTANHAVDEDEVEVALASGEAVGAEVVGRDPSTDLAVVRTKATGLPAPTWSDAPLEVGQLVFSLTRPGRGPKAAIGLVSRVGEGWRTPSGGKLDRYVELDLALHPGFSGGLVADADGKGIGVAAGGLLRGTPLVVPLATSRRVVAALLAHGSVRRGYLGIATFPVKAPPALAQDGARELALLVTAVDDASPAALAGLMVGDLLLGLDGTSVERVGDLLAALDEDRVGHVVRARIARGGAVQEVELVVGVRGDARGRGAHP